MKYTDKSTCERKREGKIKRQTEKVPNYRNIV